MGWSVDGIERKLSWFERRRIKKQHEKIEKERLDRERKQVFSKAFEIFSMQIFSNK